MTNKNEKDLRYLLGLWKDTGLIDPKQFHFFIKYYENIAANKKGKAL